MGIKVAASDFDGTIFREQQISAEDLESVRNWRLSGNKFGIVTGRAYVMLISHLKQFDLATDFNICCNGAIIYDGDGEIIFETELSKEILLDIMKEPFVEATKHYAFETALKIYCARVKSSSWVLREKNLWNFPLEIIDAAEISRLPKINQLALDFETPEEAYSAAKMLNKKFGEAIYAQKNTHSVDIVAKGINKSAGVENLLRVMKWKAETYVIGDESNDLPMIRDFGGYTVATAKDFVKREAKTVFYSVGNMLNHFSR